MTVAAFACCQSTRALKVLIMFSMFVIGKKFRDFTPNIDFDKVLLLIMLSGGYIDKCPWKLYI